MGTTLRVFLVLDIVKMKSWFGLLLCALVLNLAWSRPSAEIPKDGADVTKEDAKDPAPKKASDPKPKIPIKGIMKGLNALGLAGTIAGVGSAAFDKLKEIFGDETLKAMHDDPQLDEQIKKMAEHLDSLSKDSANDPLFNMGKLINKLNTVKSVLGGLTRITNELNGIATTVKNGK